MKCQTCFLRKVREISSICRLLNQPMVKVVPGTYLTLLPIFASGELRVAVSDLLI